MSFFPSRLRFGLIVAVTIGIIFGFLFTAARVVASEPSIPPADIVAEKSDQFNWARLEIGARVVFVSSGPKTLAARLIDEDAKTLFRFSDSDRRPVAIVELPQAQQLNRVSVQSGPHTAPFNIYLLQELPKHPSDLDYMTPVAVVDPTEPGNAIVEFAPTTARYVAVRWTRRNAGNPLEVAEISAFSLGPIAVTNSTLPLVQSGPQVIGPPVIPPVSPL